MKTIQIKTIYNGLASIRDYQLNRKDGIVLNYLGAKMTIKPAEIEKYLFADAPMKDRIFQSRYDGKEYKLLYFRFVPD